jgi:iron complex outermembrane receptor protein
MSAAAAAPFAFDAGNDWTIDLGGVYQAITSDDAQYADKDGAR